MRNINKIIIHCSATREGQEVSVATIRDWHVARGMVGLILDTITLYL
jgi:N-acetylmuramoyl-L-alanine amidase